MKQVNNDTSLTKDVPAKRKYTRRPWPPAMVPVEEYEKLLRKIERIEKSNAKPRTAVQEAWLQKGRRWREAGKHRRLVLCCCGERIISRDYWRHTVHRTDRNQPGIPCKLARKYSVAARKAWSFVA